MPNDDHIPEPWGAFLRDLDSIAIERVDFHCIGGFVITRQFGFRRETSDVDVLSINPNRQRNDFVNLAGKGSQLHKKHGVYLDPVSAIQYYPEDYETRLMEMYPGQLTNIKVFAPEAHDLALMKLERNIERDREDVKFLARKGLITAEQLELRYAKEMRPIIALPEQRYDLTMKLWVEMIREELGVK
jgi:hypothetical protein